jgi:hypothetical protein
MTMLLTIVAVAAAGTAAVLAGALAKLKTEDRRRSEARVAALSEAAGVTPAHTQDGWSGAASLPAFSCPAFADEEAGAPPGAARAVDLFEPAEASSPWGARLAIGGAIALALTGLVIGASLASSGSASTPGSAGAPGPLALTALHHVRTPGGLRVEGRIENAGDAPAPPLVATAFVFSPEGTFLASGRSPIDPAALAPGASAAFSIEVPVAAPVARYRVSFRDQAGRVVAHVDRRDRAAVARNE